MTVSAPEVYGSLRDFGLASIMNRYPQVVFKPSRPIPREGYLLATEKVVAAIDAQGNFTAHLAETLGQFTYTLAVEWLGAGGEFGSLDIIRDFPVPAGGGAIGDILGGEFDPTGVWVGETPPPSLVPGTWWLYTGPDGYVLPDGTVANNSDLIEWS